jgi:hypothetical protein
MRTDPSWLVSKYPRLGSITAGVLARLTPQLAACSSPPTHAYSAVWRVAPLRVEIESTVTLRLERFKPKRGHMSSCVVTLAESTQALH